MVADIEELENLESPSVSCRAVSVAILTDGVVGCSRVFLRIRLRGSPPLGPGDLVTVLPPGTATSHSSCAMGWRSQRVLEVLTSSFPQHLQQEDQYQTSRILISRMQADSGKP